MTELALTDSLNPGSTRTHSEPLPPLVGGPSDEEPVGPPEDTPPCQPGGEDFFGFLRRSRIDNKKVLIPNYYIKMLKIQKIDGFR